MISYIHSIRRLKRNRNKFLQQKRMDCKYTFNAVSEITKREGLCFYNSALSPYFGDALRYMLCSDSLFKNITPNNECWGQPINIKKGEIY